MNIPRLLRLLLLPVMLVPTFAAGAEAVFKLPVRKQSKVADGSGGWSSTETTLNWDAARTAVVICDMWDKHTCDGATRRVAEMAPRMNELVKKARAQGAFIIHCPSDTMKFYEGVPGRKLAQSAPKVETAIPLQRWCNLDKTKEAPLPIDDSDGGCDTAAPWPKGAPYPWTRQIATIEIYDGDAITDSAEAFYLMRQRGITNVIVMGVHLNMCVLGRPFSIRQMVNQGQNVVLVRDLTDTMYNPQRAPHVPHTVGTELMLGHVERYWCPTISSVAFLGGKEFRFQEDRRPTVLFLVGDTEYKTGEMVPAWARMELEWRGVQCRFVIDDPKKTATLEGLEQLDQADALFISIKRRALTPEQYAVIRRHIAAGKPVLGIRTASHAFGAKTPEPGRSNWETFDRDVFGGHYQNHYGKGAETVVNTPPGVVGHPLLTGVPTRIRFSSHLYLCRNLIPGTVTLLDGHVDGKADVIEPVAWIRTDEGRKNFYTSLGSPEDFREAGFRQLLRNVVLWSVGHPVPPADSTLARP